MTGKQVLQAASGGANHPFGSPGRHLLPAAPLCPELGRGGAALVGGENRARHRLAEGAAPRQV